MEVVETVRRGYAMELAADAVGTFDRVVAVGGDGTLNEVVSGLMAGDRRGTDLPELGFVPSGTANAAARAFGLTSDPVSAAEQLPRSRSRPVDVGIVRHEKGERPFLLWCGAGYDAVVIAALNESRLGLMGLTGLVANAPGVLRAVARYPAPTIRVEAEGRGRVEANSVVLANVGDIAFGASFAEEADPFDGMLDLVAASVPSKAALLGSALSLLGPGLSRHARARHATVTSVAMRSDGTVPFHLDGEPVGTLPLEARLEPGAIRLLLTHAR